MSDSTHRSLVDVISDTETRPSVGTRLAMATAAAGDERRREPEMFWSRAVIDAVEPASDRHHPRPRLLLVEQTTNWSRGRVWPRDRLRGVLDTAAQIGLRTYLDGARLLNAAIVSGAAPAIWRGPRLELTGRRDADTRPRPSRL